LVPSSRVKKSNAASLDFLALEDGTAEERWSHALEDLD
jgi:hypothetical protein